MHEYVWSLYPRQTFILAYLTHKEIQLQYSPERLSSKHWPHQATTRKYWQQLTPSQEWWEPFTSGVPCICQRCFWGSQGKHLLCVVAPLLWLVAHHWRCLYVWGECVCMMVHSCMTECEECVRRADERGNNTPAQVLICKSAAQAEALPNCMLHTSDTLSLCFG